jgi:hypothetical protein
MESVDDLRHGSTRKRPFNSLDDEDPKSGQQATTACKVEDNILVIRSDELWHKAKVLFISENYVHVVYISSGETEQIPASHWASRLSSRYVMVFCL